MAEKKKSVQATEVSSSENCNDFIYDEIDEFHKERDKQILGDLKTTKKKERVEEVLSVVAPESDLSDDEEYESDSDDSADERLGKKKNESDYSGKKSADAWGKKKLAFYGSHADKDFGGWDEEEAEALELEEEDAITRQKKLDAGIDAVDFAGLLASDDEEQEAVVSQKKAKKDEKKSENVESGNKKEQVDYMLKHSGGFDQFVKEYNERKAQFDELKPMLNSILSCMNDYDCPFTRQVKAIIAAYTQYLQSYLMFFYLKETTPFEKFKSIENHPILDDIMKQYLVIKQIDDFIINNQRRLMKVADRLKDDPEYAEMITHPEPSKKKRRTEIDEEMDAEPMEEDISSVFARMARGNGKKDGKVGVFGPSLSMEDIGGDDDDKKRRITYEMQKNKGLTVQRKKGVSHSRVKKRKQFKKATHIKKSQVPDVQREVSKYGGERRGIKAGVIKSIKLKA